MTLGKIKEVYVVNDDAGMEWDQPNIAAQRRLLTSS